MQRSRIKNPKPINVIDIKNFSAQYLKISPESNVKGTKLKIEFNTTNNIRVTRILLTKTKNEFMYVPFHKKQKMMEQVIMNITQILLNYQMVQEI